MKSYRLTDCVFANAHNKYERINEAPKVIRILTSAEPMSQNWDNEIKAKIPANVVLASYNIEEVI